MKTYTYIPTSGFKMSFLGPPWNALNDHIKHKIEMKENALNFKFRFEIINFKESFIVKHKKQAAGDKF